MKFDLVIFLQQNRQYYKVGVLSILVSFIIALLTTILTALVPVFKLRKIDPIKVIMGR